MVEVIKCIAWIIALILCVGVVQMAVIALLTILEELWERYGE